MSEDLKAAQHFRQAAEKELLKLKQKAAEVAGKLELTGQRLQLYSNVDGCSVLTHGCPIRANDFQYMWMHPYGCSVHVAQFI